MEDNMEEKVVNLGVDNINDDINITRKLNIVKALKFLNQEESIYIINTDDRIKKLVYKLYNDII